MPLTPQCPTICVSAFDFPSPDSVLARPNYAPRAESTPSSLSRGHFSTARSPVRLDRSSGPPSASSSLDRTGCRRSAMSHSARKTMCSIPTLHCQRQARTSTQASQRTIWNQRRSVRSSISLICRASSSARLQLTSHQCAQQGRYRKTVGGHERPGQTIGRARRQHVGGRRAALAAQGHHFASVQVCRSDEAVRQ